MSDLVDELEDLEASVSDPAARERVGGVIDLALEVQADPIVFGRGIRGYDRADAAESLLGSLLFGIPMFVEGGTQEIGAFVATRPLSLLATVAGAVGLAFGILYVAEIQDVRVADLILGVVPRRLVGVVGIASLTAVVVMTGWGRVTWSEPWLALSQVAVAFVPMVVGASLGDILPGT
jgi:uncharacterized membrane protein